MPEMIDKEVTLLLLNTAIKQFGENWLQDKMTKNGLLIAKQIVSKQPTIEPEVRHGRWILCKDQYNVDNDNGNYAYYCSCCKHQDVHAESAKVSFCWNCGARMDGGADNG